MGAIDPAVRFDCESMTITDINVGIREAAKRGAATVSIERPAGRHNLGVAITDPIELLYMGDVGNFAASLSDGIRAEIFGNAGWAVGENLMSGEIVVHGDAATACAASMRGGTIVVKGGAGARSGIGMKGGTLIVGGDAGYMTGFMMQKGVMIICGDADRALADSMYDGVVYVGGTVAGLGNGADMREATGEEYGEVKALLERYGIEAPASFRTIRPNGSLHNFNKKEFGIWKEIL